MSNDVSELENISLRLQKLEDHKQVMKSRLYELDLRIRDLERRKRRLDKILSSSPSN